MKHYILLAILGIIFIWSCNSDQSATKDSSNDQNNIVENNQNSTGRDGGNEVEPVQQKPQINAQFKTFLDKFSKKSLPYKETPTGSEKYDKMSIEEQVAYISKAEKLSEADLKDMAEYTDFYYISNPINTDTYHAIVYGRFEMGSVYYFLCTYNNDGKLISNIDFAAYEMMSSGPQAGQEFNVKGTIDANLEVTVKSEEETRKYKIGEDGKIVKM